VRLLLDQNLSVQIAGRLRAAGHDAVHVRERGLERAEDDVILQLAAAEKRTLISEDTDFGALLAEAGQAAPSFVLIRSADPLTPDDQADLLLANLGAVSEDLEKGCVVVLGRGRLRVRPLPLRPVD